MATFIQEGRYIDYTPGSDVAAGAVVKSDDTIFIAPRAIASGTTGSLATGGVWEVPKVSGATWTLGEPVYWVTATSNFSTVSSGNTLAGYAAEAAVSGATVGKIVLNGNG